MSGNGHAPWMQVTILAAMVGLAAAFICRTTVDPAPSDEIRTLRADLMEELQVQKSEMRMQRRALQELTNTVERRQAPPGARVPLPGFRPGDPRHGTQGAGPPLGSADPHDEPHDEPTRDADGWEPVPQRQQPDEEDVNDDPL